MININGLRYFFSFKTFLFVLVVFLTACSDEQLFVNELKQIAIDVNKKCPQMIDSETRLDGIEVQEPNTLVYKYTLVNVYLQDVDTHQFYLSMWPGLLSYVKVNKEMQKLRDNNTNIHYLYKDKAQKLFYLFKINPTHYNKP